MSLDSLIKSRIVAHIAGEPRLLRRRKAFEARRSRRGAAHVVDYFHDVADPYAHLTAQVLRDFQDRYGIELQPHLISGPPGWAVPAPESLASHALVDAWQLARKAGLLFPDAVDPPTPERIEDARAMIAASLLQPDFAETAAAVGAALWQGDALPPCPKTDPADAMAHGDAVLAQGGHYLGASFHYGGEWYWGIDRLHYLEARLQGLGVSRPGIANTPIFAPPTVGTSPTGGQSTVVEAFVSFRSPYSYVAFDRARALAGEYGATFQPRPVLPMVMRGLAVPRAKKMYILRDAAREARRHNIPFGRICDPLGKAVERGYTLIGFARDAGQLGDFCASFMRGVWSEGIDARTDAGLAKIVERAGLDWQDAKPFLVDESWRAEVDENRKELTSLNLWGVPSFRCGDVAIWGQDRLWVLEEHLKTL
jgi:2-hydroxychromene-2-carboxylate isomerase